MERIGNEVSCVVGETRDAFAFPIKWYPMSDTWSRPISFYRTHHDRVLDKLERHTSIEKNPFANFRGINVNNRMQPTLCGKLLSSNQSYKSKAPINRTIHSVSSSPWPALCTCRKQFDSAFRLFFTRIIVQSSWPPDYWTVYTIIWLICQRLINSSSPYTVAQTRGKKILALWQILDIKNRQWKNTAQMKFFIFKRCQVRS